MKHSFTIALLVLTNQILVSADQADEDESWLVSPRRRLSDIATIPAYPGALQTVGSWGGANYGGQIKIENNLCHDLVYHHDYVLTHGWFLNPPPNVSPGTVDGCTLTGHMNEGAEGMIQYEIANTGYALS